ncbi:ribosomal protein lateral stalk subunit P0 [Homo sapiens]|uniref:Ribosomal protein lateral stalk subunit P0 n=1 Tax=Homo sapiens TaxID=9606 RepID=F8VYN4_HUMAN|nr:ribosomal protein lateral stalk subunit P0 [Homo sapiens]KAI4068521.1 ribosomal protein lateral stalk subunit P0 [Homo sapiens]
MPREDRATWKSNYFLKIIVSAGNYWMIIRNVSLWEQTMWAPSRCSRSACPFAGRLWC